MIYTFNIETRGSKIFQVEAETPEKACSILANCDNENDYLVEQEDDWVLDAWNRKPIEEN
jgi:hypothetical protein